MKIHLLILNFNFSSSLKKRSTYFKQMIRKIMFKRFQIGELITALSLIRKIAMRFLCTN